MKRSLKKSISELEKKGWTHDAYAKQSWGIWMHSISSYVGRIKPSFAHFLINIFTDVDDVILDPFCGIGTIPLEADNLGRKSIGNDLNPYAFMIANSKFDRLGLESELNYLSTLSKKLKDVEVKNVPEWVKVFYHPKTLKEILSVRDCLIKDKRYFLMGCLLGIVHGHRDSHLSMRTGYIIPYIPKPLPIAEYREVIPRLIKKAKRMYSDDVSESTIGKIMYGDARKLKILDKSVDVIISSPPYYHTLDYVHSNRLRLWFAGIDFPEQEKLTKNLIQQRASYLDSMKEVGIELLRVMKDDGICIFVLGDVHLSSKNSLNTAEDISKLYKEIGFKTHAIVDDEIPPSKTTIVKYLGEEGIGRKQTKLDRILIMTKNGSKL
jgi:DNA modification methylase